MTIFNLTDGETLEVTRATLILADGQAAPAGIDLIIATLDNNGGGTKQSELIAGDGSVQVDVEGSPLSSYTNETGGPQTVAIMVDNGNFGAGTGSNQDVQSNYTGAVS